MDQTKPATPSGYSCRRCGWPFPNPHPSPKRRRAHKRICGTLEGYTDKIITHDEPHSGSDSDGGEKQNTSSPKIDKSGSSAGGVEGRPNRSEDDMLSAATEFSDTGISPGVTSEVKKVDEISEVFESPISPSKDADKVQENETKCSVPLVEDHYGSHKDKVIDQMEHSDTVQDQGGDVVHAVSVASDTPLVDKAETLIEDFKDQKTVYSNVSSDDKQAEKRSVVDIFEVKTLQENVHESQPSDPAVVIEDAKVAESADKHNEAEASGDKHQVVTLGELIESEIKEAEIDLKGSKDSVKVGSSETLAGETGGSVLTGQFSGIDASFDSSMNSLEGRWGSVSDISDVFGKSESRLGRCRSDAFEGPSLVESEEETVEQKASEIKKVKVRKSQSPKSEANEDAISKVTNWSTSGHIATTPLRRLMREGKSSNPKPSSSLIQKAEDSPESSQPGKSKLTQETLEVNQESSPVRYSGGGKLVKKKTKVISTLARFVCCSAPVTK